MELGIAHLYQQFFAYISFFRIPIESHMILPSEIITIRDISFDKQPDDISLMHEIGDDLFELLPKLFGVVLENTFSKLSKKLEDIF